ncbi:MAG: hypothetical protein Q8928_00205 [Bacteroidota bacterium]|nr:hypothetical protein [Bacteroidota bacterium]
MSQQDYENKLAAIQAVSDADVATPNIPISVAVQEAENLYYWCQTDKDKLVAAGLRWELVDDLPARAAACRYAQSVWNKDHQSVEEAQKEWKEKSPAAFDLRDELLHHFFFAYRNAPDVYSKVNTIAEGNGNADMIQDLSDLTILGKQYPDPLNSISLDMALLDEASSTSDEMATLLARVNGGQKTQDQTKILRDKAFTHLKDAVDEIRHTGQYVFWRDDDRKKGYISPYFRQRNKANAKKQSTTESQQTAPTK